MSTQVSETKIVEEVNDFDELLSMVDDDEIELSDDIDLDIDTDGEDTPAEVLEDVEHELATIEIKQEAYAAQDEANVEEVSENSKPDPASIDGTAPKVKTKVAKSEKAPRKTMTGGKKSDVIRDRLGEDVKGFALTIPDAGLPPEELSKLQDEFLESVDKMAIKVGEKAVNLIAAAHGHAKLSTYTQLALNFIAKCGEEGFTSADLKAFYQNQKENGVKGYSAGTANAQAGQMIQLLPSLKMVTQSGNRYLPNADSMLLAALGS